MFERKKYARFFIKTMGFWWKKEIMVELLIVDEDNWKRFKQFVVGKKRKGGSRKQN